MSEEKEQVVKVVEDKAGTIDKMLGKIVSRKLFVFFIASLFYIFSIGDGGVTFDSWLTVALVYIGMQGIADIAKKWKYGKN